MIDAHHGCNIGGLHFRRDRAMGWKRHNDFGCTKKRDTALWDTDGILDLINYREEENPGGDEEE